MKNTSCSGRVASVRPTAGGTPSRSHPSSNARPMKRVIERRVCPGAPVGGKDAGRQLDTGHVDLVLGVLGQVDVARRNSSAESMRGCTSSPGGRSSGSAFADELSTEGRSDRVLGLRGDCRDSISAASAQRSVMSRQTAIVSSWLHSCRSRSSSGCSSGSRAKARPDSAPRSPVAMRSIRLSASVKTRCSVESARTTMSTCPA